MGLRPAMDQIFKSEAQRTHCLTNDRMIRGRYLALVETTIGILGGDALRARAHGALGYTIRADDLYPVADWVRLVVVAAEGGVSPRRLGMNFFPKFRQTHQELFPSRKVTLREALGIVEQAARKETTYGGAPYEMKLESPTTLRIIRKENPLPCEFFAGIIAGTLDTLGYKGTVTETACRWLGAPACELEAVLSQSMPM